MLLDVWKGCICVNGLDEWVKEEMADEWVKEEHTRLQQVSVSSSCYLPLCVEARDFGGEIMSCFSFSMTHGSTLFVMGHWGPPWLSMFEIW